MVIFSRSYHFDIRFESTVGFCSHSFCSSCLGAYVSKAIHDGPACLVLRCHVPHCGAVIGQDMVDLLVSDEGKMKYKEFSIRSYVENNREIKWENNRGLKWCPAPGCEYAIEYDLKSESYDVSERFDVTCHCSFSFCWNCLEESHCPVKCETAAEWMLENSSEQNVEQERGVEKRAKRCYMRYFHYYKRWVANHKSREKALATLYEMKTRKLERLGKIRKEHGLKTREFGFIAEAWEQIVECRGVLKWSYAYGYYMPEEASSKTKLFEYLQGEAEVALERLHDCAENTLKRYEQLAGLAHEFDATGIELINRTLATRKYFAKFVNGVSNGLAEAEGDPLEVRTIKR